MNKLELFFKYLYLNEDKVPISKDMLRYICELSRPTEKEILDKFFIEYNGRHCECNKMYINYDVNHYFDVNHDVKRNKFGNIIEINIDHDLDYDYKDGGGDCIFISRENSYRQSKILKEIKYFKFLEKINLKYAQLFGEIPKELGFLPNLKYISIVNDNSFNKDHLVLGLGNILPRTLENLKSLEYLELSDVNIHEESLNIIGNLKSLKFLSLTNIFSQTEKVISFPECLLELKNLEELHLYVSFSGEIPEHICELNLRKFSFDKVTGVLPSKIFNSSINEIFLDSETNFLIDFRNIFEIKPFSPYSQILNCVIKGEKPVTYRNILLSKEELEQEALNIGVGGRL